MLHLHESVQNKKSPMPILSNSMIKDNYVYSTDLDNWLITNSVHCEDGIYQIISGKLFKTDTDFEDFPSLELSKPMRIFNANESLIPILKELSEYCNKEDMRPAMTGVFFDSKNDCLVATNGHVLRVIPYNLPGLTGFIMQANSIKKLVQLVSKAKLKKFDIEISIHFNSYSNRESKYIKFQFNGITFICRLISEKFPRYQSVIPFDFNQTMLFNTDYFSGCVKSLKPFVEKTKKIVVIDFDGKNISATNEDLNIKETMDLDFSEVHPEVDKKNITLIMPCQIENYLERNAIGFNRDYLELCLKSIKSDFVKFFYNANIKAVLLQS